jgi:hypothetical protein
MDKWSDYFEIRVLNQEADLHYTVDYIYQLVVKNTGKVIGTYNSKRYAERQAKLKFQRILDKIEKILLG